MHARNLILAGVLAATGICSARAADTLSAADRAFAAKVSQGGMFEVQAGQLASERGSTQVVRDQGTTEAHDHGLVGDKLKSILSDAGVTEPDALDASFRKELDELKALSGKAFDRAYLRDMETVHAKDGAAFATEARNGADPRLRAFAAETHQIVESHIGELNAVGRDQ